MSAAADFFSSDVLSYIPDILPIATNIITVPLYRDIKKLYLILFDILIVA